MDYTELYESNARTYVRKFPKMFVAGHGTTLVDEDGDKYLDLLACAGALPLGHNHPVAKNAIRAYANSDLPQQMLDMATPAKRDFINEIRQWLPDTMKDFKYQTCGPAGTDAVEAGLKLCRIATGRQMVISFSGGFHGQTLGALMCMGNVKVKKVQGLTNMMNHTLPFPNKYHWFDKEASEEQMIDQSLTMFEQLFTDDESGVAVPACVILECVQGEGGVVVAPFRWVKGIRALCTKYNIPMICDEVQSGFMRTGKMFAFNHSEITPDVLILSKALGGSMPMAMIFYKPELDVWTGGAHSGTFRGNQISFMVGKAVLNFLRTNDFHLTAKQTGEYVVQELTLIKNKYPSIIKEIRGIGLMLGVQIEHKSITARMIQNDLFNKKNIIIECGGRAGSVLRLLCALDIGRSQIDYFIKSLDDVLESLEREHCHTY